MSACFDPWDLTDVVLLQASMNPHTSVRWKLAKLSHSLDGRGLLDVGITANNKPGWSLPDSIKASPDMCWLARFTYAHVHKNGEGRSRSRSMPASANASAGRHDGRQPCPPRPHPVSHDMCVSPMAGGLHTH